MINLSRYKLHQSPFKLIVDVTSKCNLRCKMCFQAEKPASFEEHFLSMDMVQRLLPLAAQCQVVQLGLDGEALTHPDFFDIVRAFDSVREDVQVHFVSNGHLINDDVIEHIFASNVYGLSISFDGFNLWRGHPGAEKILGNVKRLLTAKKAANRSLPHVGLVTTLGKDNADQLRWIVDFCAEHGIKYITVEGLRLVDPQSKYRDYVLENAALEGEEYIRPLYEDAIRHGAKRGVRIGPSCLGGHLYDKRLRCEFPFTDFCVHLDGTVDMCRHGYPSGMNVMRDDPLEIWNATSYLRLRLNMAEGVFQGYCRECPVAASIMDWRTRDSNEVA